MYKLSAQSVEHSVHATGIPLSERFKKVPSHNPLRPNAGVTRTVAAEFDDVVAGPSAGLSSFEVAPRRGNRLPLGVGVNKLAVLRATKDAEILRLRTQLRTMQLKLKRLTNGGSTRGLNGQLIQNSRNLSNKFAVRRHGGGGGVVAVAGIRGKHHVNIKSKNALSILGIGNKVSRVPRSPRKSSGKGGVEKLNFFGSPKSKEDLDDELEKYMSKSKSKQKTNLDKELDEYMKVARAQSFAGKVGLIPTTPPEPISTDLEDTEMEIVE